MKLYYRIYYRIRSWIGHFLCRRGLHQRTKRLNWANPEIIGFEAKCRRGWDDYPSGAPLDVDPECGHTRYYIGSRRKVDPIIGRCWGKMEVDKQTYELMRLALVYC